MSYNHFRECGYFVLLALALAGCSIGVPDEPQHQFALPSAPPFLTEDMAVGKACEAMALDKHPTNDWQIAAPAGRPTRAPDGTADRYFRRTFSTNHGSVWFVRGAEIRDYIVQLNGDRVICYCHHGY
ncbi:MAG: hypothetical protein NTZ16_14200 [Verrucomicrobia bacterium]|nr:hypothetical protein [Verrucomicrobiota bacterium]